MGVDTKGYLNKNVKAREIYDVIVSEFDKNAIFDIKDDIFYEGFESGAIHFKDGDDNRMLFYCVTPDKEENTEYADGKLHGNLILGAWGNSVKIMSKILSVFGGYIDENDCDSIEAYYIPKDGDFKYDEYIKSRNNIADILSEELSEKDKIKIANEILKHKEELKNLL